MPDEDTPWYIQLLVCLGVMVAVAVIVGGVLAVFGVAAARLVTFPAGSSPTTSSVPTPTPSTPSSSPGGQQSPSPAPQSARRHRRQQTHAIILSASPRQVATYGRINLTGSYLAADGTTLQVQRREASGWVDFPTTTSVSAGNFSTYIETGRSGTNRLRVIDLSTGKTSNVVRVQVG